MPILKMLELSTDHITKETAEWLTDQANLPSHRVPELIVYLKAGYGWFFPVPDQNDSDFTTDNLLTDLEEIIHYAWHKECLWVLLDCDAESVEGLTIHEWEEESK